MVATLMSDLVSLSGRIVACSRQFEVILARVFELIAWFQHIVVRPSYFLSREDYAQSIQGG